MSVNKYPKYKPSGVEWIGEIPEYWRSKRIKYEVEYQKGKNPKELSFDVKGKIYLTMEYLRGDPKQIYYVKDYEDYLTIYENEILLLWDGSNAGEFIKSKEGVLSSTMAFLNIYNLDNKYAWFFFKNFERYLKAFTIGMGVPHVNGEEFKNHIIIIPPKSEQTAIANFLDQKTARIDTLIEKKQKLIDLLKEERTAVINQAVTRGIDPNVKLKDSGIDWLGDIPEHWEVKKLKYVGEIISGGAFSSTAFQKEGKARVIKITNIQHDELLLEETEYLPENYAEIYSRFLIYYGDILFALTRPIISSGLKSTRVEVKNEIMLLNQRNAIFRVKEEQCSDFFYYITHCLYFYQLFEVNMDTTGQQPNISPLDIANFTIDLPPKEEQTQIVQHIEAETKRIDGTISKIEKEIELLSEYRTALICEVVTGKIKV